MKAGPPWDFLGREYSRNLENQYSFTAAHCLPSDVVLSLQSLSFQSVLGSNFS